MPILEHPATNPLLLSSDFSLETESTYPTPSSFLVVNRPTPRKRESSRPSSHFTASPPPAYATFEPLDISSKSAPLQSAVQSRTESVASINLVGEGQTADSGWSFHFALRTDIIVSEGTLCAAGTLSSIRVVFSFILGAVWGTAGLLLSVIVTSLAAIFPSLKAQAPRSVPLARRKTVRSPVSSPRSSPRSDTRSLPEDASVDPGSSNEVIAESPPTDANPSPTERRVTFQLEVPRESSFTFERFSAEATSERALASINTPITTQFSPTHVPDEDAEDTASERPSSSLGRRDSVSVASGSGSSKGFMSKFIKRRSLTTAPSEFGETFDEAQSYFISPPKTASSSLPPTPASRSTDLPAVVEQEVKATRRTSLKLSLKAFKRRSLPVQPVAQTVESVTTETETPALENEKSSATSTPKRTKTFPFPYSTPRGRKAEATPPPPSRASSVDNSVGLDLDLGPTVVEKQRVASESASSPPTSKKRTTRLRSRSKPPTAGPTSPRLLDRHAQMAMMSVQYTRTSLSDTESTRR